MQRIIGCLLLVPLLFAIGCKKIEGRITQNGAGLAGVTVTLSGGASDVATTDDDGRYTFEFDDVSGRCTVTPNLGGYRFTPDRRSFEMTGDTKSGVDFTAEYNGPAETGFFAKSYFGQSSPYPMGWLNPTKKQYVYPQPRTLFQRADGGFVFCGAMTNGQEEDAMVTWLNESGGIEKYAVYHGGFESGEKRQRGIFFAATPTPDGGLLAVGTSHLTTSANVIYGDSAVLAVKFDAAMNMVWSRVYGIRDYYEQEDPAVSFFIEGLGYAVVPTGDGGFLLAGTQLIKIDAHGSMLWSRNFEFGSIQDIRQTADGDYVLVANSRNDDGNRIMRIDDTGDIIWNREYRLGALNTRLAAIEIIMDGSGNEVGCLVAGRVTYNTVRSSDWLVLRLDLSGALVWQKTLGGATYDPDQLIFSDEQPFSIVRSSDGNFLIGGDSESFNSELNDDDAVIVKMNGAGDLLWQKAYGLSGSLIDLSVTEDGFAFSGMCSAGGESRALIVHCDDNGELPGHENGLLAKEISFTVAAASGGMVAHMDEEPLEDIVLIVADPNPTERVLNANALTH